MRLKTTVAIIISFFFFIHNLSAQVFWVEDFTSACGQGCQLPYTSGNGTWTWVSTGTNGAAANTWFVSLQEGGFGRGVCGAPGTGTESSLHVGNVSNSPAASIFCPTGDCGAAADYSACCPDVTANARATSPVINCTGKSNITLSFNYIENGLPGTDYATVYYFDGSIWNNIATPPPTALCRQQGKWTYYSVPLPASANNNANVQIGFNWQNTAGNSGADPSFAVDSVQLSSAAASPPTANFTSNDSIICLGDSVHFTDLSTGFPTSWKWTFNGGSPSTSTLQNPVVYYSSPGYYTVKEVVQNINGKDSITKINYIRVVPHPSVAISPNTTICADSTITLTASGGVKYTWSTGATTSSINVTPASTKTYYVIVSNDTCATADSVKITVIPLPTITLSGNTTICTGDSTTIKATGGGTYFWSTGATTDSITVKPSSTQLYTLKVTNGGCSKDTSVTVTVNTLPNVTISGNTSICIGDSTTLTATGGGTYLWTNNGSTSGTITVKPSADSTFTVQVTNGCTKDTSIRIKVNAKPVPTVGPKDSICRGESVQLSASGGTSYLWRPATGLSDTTVANPIATPSSTTEYTVYVANGGCIAIDSEEVIVNPAIPITACCGATITAGDQTPINVTPLGSILWVPSTGLACDTCQSTYASPTVTTWYYVYVTEPDGCVEKDSIHIIVKEKCGDVFVPNAFSPNNDGQNDVLQVMCDPRCISGYDFKIYDRWGNMVFHATDPGTTWDGAYKGKLMNAGSFVYYLQYVDLTNNMQTKSQKGSITLVR